MQRGVQREEFIQKKVSAERNSEEFREEYAEKKERHNLTRLGRLWAQSGYIGPMGPRVLVRTGRPKFRRSSPI